MVACQRGVVLGGSRGQVLLSSWKHWWYSRKGAGTAAEWPARTGTLPAAKHSPSAAGGALVQQDSGLEQPDVGPLLMFKL